MQEIFRTHYKALKEIFTMASIESNFPDFRQIAFSNFMKRAGVLDRNINTSVIDTYFVAANFEVESNDNNDDQALQRHEFLEIIIRIAQGKYI